MPVESATGVVYSSFFASSAAAATAFFFGRKPSTFSLTPLSCSLTWSRMGSRVLALFM